MADQLEDQCDALHITLQHLRLGTGTANFDLHKEIAVFNRIFNNTGKPCQEVVSR